METTYTGMEGFSNPPQNVADIPDGQENYGLMISELLANDYSNCGAVPDEISPLDNMVLHNGEVLTPLPGLITFKMSFLMRTS